jgi:hypothetical protein
VTEPTVDGVAVSNIIKLDQNGHYCRAEAASPRELKARKSFTLFVGFDGEADEEIDVMATDKSDASIIGDLAILWHYDKGVKIVGVRENIPGVLYF